MGKFIVIEGIDGSGKTTIANHVSEKLNDNGYKTIFVNKKNTDICDEYIKKFMGNIRKSLWENSPTDPVGEVPEKAWLFLHSLWYTMMEEKVINKLIDDYEFVVMDGWYYKFLARHLTNGEFDFELSYSIINTLRKGDFTFLLDIKPEVCFKRRDDFKPSELGAHEIKQEGKGETTFNKFVRYQNMVRNQYLGFGKEYGFNVIDTNSKNIDEVSEEIVNKIFLEKEGN